MIRGIIYLTGLATLVAVGVTVGAAYDVQDWPWREYLAEGRGYLADKLDPRGEAGGGGPGSEHSPGEAETRHRARPSPLPSNDVPVFGPPAGSARADAPVATAVRHTVRRGDTLYQIAARYYGRGELWPRIAAANGILRASGLRVGAVLVIPFGEGPAPGGEDSARAWGARMSISPAVGPDDERTEPRE